MSNVATDWDDILKITEKLTGEDELEGIGLVNFNKTELAQWEHLIPDATHVVLPLEYAARNVTWESLYPEWIDEEEEVEEGSGAGWVSLFYLKLTKDIFVHSLKVLGAPAIMQGAPSNTQT